jgi:membrane-associated phospholipid phosphatase
MGYTSPYVAEALNRSRSAIIDPGETRPVWTLAPRSEAGEHDHAFHWDPWVRSFLMAQESTNTMEFQTDFVAFRGGRVPRVRLTVRDRRDGPRLPLATLVAPPDSVFDAQVAKVLAWAELREERAPEIFTQIDGCLAFWGSIVPLQSARMRHTRELIDAAMQMTMFVEMKLKHELACWRPADRSWQIQPMIRTPGHGALPSGHCTEAYVMAELLKALLNCEGDDPARRSVTTQFERLAQRISTNRVVAGVHFPVDNIAGRILGTALGEYFAYLCGARARNSAALTWHHATFLGQRCDGEIEFDPATQPLSGSDAPGFYGFEPPARRPLTGPAGNSVLRELFERARHECDDLRIAFG